MDITHGADVKNANPLIFSLILVFSYIQSLSAAEEVSPFERLSQLNEQLDAYRGQIADLESEYDAYHPSIQEPLSSMVSLLIEFEDYERVADLQNRQLQLARTNLGLLDLGLIPLLEDIISNQMRMGDWSQVSDTLEHIRYIHASQSNPDVEQQLMAMDRQAHWYMNRVYLDGGRDGVRGFFYGRAIYRRMEELAEETYGEDSLEMIPWLYKRAYNYFQLVELLNARGRFGDDAIDRLVSEDGASRLQSSRRGSINLGNSPYWGPSPIVTVPSSRGSIVPITEPGERIGERYLRDGLILVTRIEELIATQDDVEARAMALIYHGDFQLLMSSGLGYRSYRKAREQLLEAGIAEEKIESFFNTPTAIPAQKYFTTLQDAIDYQQRGLNDFEKPDSNADDEQSIVFTAWSEDLGSSPRPPQDFPLVNTVLDLAYVDLEVNISRTGNVSSVDVISAMPDERGVRRQATRAIREISFRPAIIEGATKRLRDVRIRYLYPQEQE